MRRMPASAWFILMESVFLVMAYFGNLNPHPLGLLSGFFIFSLAIFFGGVFGVVGRGFFVASVVLVWCTQYVLTVSNWWYFQYFQSYFNYDALKLGMDALASYRAISGFENKGSALVLAITSGFFLIFTIKSYSLKVARTKASMVMSVAWLFVAIISGSILSVSFDRYRELNIFSLAPAYLSPIHAFFVSPSVVNESPDAVLGYEEFKEMNVAKGQGRNKNDYNVIVIVLESMRASLIGHYNGGLTKTPNFDSFARENLVATQFYANSNYTVKGETAILCGIFDHNSKPPISKYSDDIKKINCLPSILKKQGYRSVYFHGNKAEFYSRDKYMKLVGFDELQFFDQNRRELTNMPEIGWGVADESMYGFVLSRLNGDMPKPFFASVMTLSSHYPFDWDWGIEFPDLATAIDENEMFANYLKAAYYEDYAFGKFWEAFKESNLYENTIVVVTSDHGIWSFPNKPKLSLVEQNERFFRIPLMIYYPGLDIARTLTQVGSQIDIPPTILGLLGVSNREDEFIGKDMLEAAAKPWVISMKSGEVTARVENVICSTSSGECGGVHQECTAKNYGEILLRDVSDIQNCFLVDGDILQNGSYSAVADSRGLVAKALYIIRRQNREVFGEKSK